MKHVFSISEVKKKKKDAIIGHAISYEARFLFYSSYGHEAP